MRFRCPYVDPRSWFLALALLLFASPAPAQNIILHLRNGDRIAGTIVSENTNAVTISTVWIKELVVPVAQIERREDSTPPTIATGIANAPVPVPAVTNVLKLAKTGELAAPSNSFWHRWKGEAAVGLDVERGATDHQLYYGKANLAYAQPYVSDPKQFFRNILTYDAAYGKTDGTLSDNRMGGTSKTDFDLSRKIYLYNLGAGSYDELRKIDLHYEDGPGAGYHWITRSNFLVNLELGANYQVEDRSDDTHTHTFYTRLGEDVTWKLNKQMSLTEKAEYFIQSDYLTQFRLRFESTLSYALLFNLSLNFSVIDLYDTRPTATVPNNDFQVRTSLGVKF